MSSTPASSTLAAPISAERKTRHWLTAMAAWALLALLAVAPGLPPGRSLAEDDQSRFIARHWLAGHYPVWNDELGRAVLAEPAAPLFYPLVLLHALPQRWSDVVSAGVHLWLAAAGMWLLARSYGMAGPAATFASAVFMLSAPLLNGLSAPTLHAGMLLPWVLLVTRALVQRASAWRIVALAGLLSVTVFGAGAPAASAALAGAIGLVMVHLLLGESIEPAAVVFAHEPPPDSAPQRRWRVLAALPAVALSAGIALLVAGVQIWPQIELAGSWRAVFLPAVGASNWHDSALVLLGTFWPYVPARSAWVGTISLAMAAVAILFDRSRAMIFWLIFAALWLGAAAFAGAWLDRSTLLLSGALAISMLAGFGLQRILTQLQVGTSTFWRHVDGIRIALALVALILAGAFLATLWRDGFAPGAYRAVVPLIAFIIGGLLLSWVVSNPASPLGSSALPWVALAGVELMVFAAPLLWQKTGVQSAQHQTAHPALSDLPRAWIAPSAQWLAPEKIAVSLQRGEIDPGQLVLLDSAEPLRSSLSRQAPRSQGELSLEWLADTPARQELRIIGGGGGWLVVTGGYDAGWTARTSYEEQRDRRPARIVERPALVARAFDRWRAVPLPRTDGATLTVTLRYQPQAQQHGTMLALTGGIIAAIVLGWGMTRSADATPEMATGFE